MTRSAHPLAELFPLIEGAEFDTLIADIKAHRLHEPIVIYEDQILNGRNRYRASIEAGLEPRFVPYRGDDPIAYIVSLNLKRCHGKHTAGLALACPMAA